LQDPKLNELAESLPVVVLSSRAPATATNYAGAFLRWKKWAINRRGIGLFPAKLDPTSHPLVNRYWLDVSGSSLAEPITPEILPKLAQPGTSLADVRTITCLALLVFSAITKLASLREMMFPYFQTTWNFSLNQVKQISIEHIVIACTNSQICPVTMLERYVINSWAYLALRQRRQVPPRFQNK